MPYQAQPAQAAEQNGAPLHLPHDGVTRVRVDQRRDRDVVPGGPRRASLQGVRAPVGLAVRSNKQGKRRI